MHVTVYHNVATDPQGRTLGMLDGYAPGHPLVPVATYTDDGGDPTAVAEEAFRLFNVGDDPDMGTPDARALAYRARGNRSLSKGDVVHCTDGQGHWWLACASRGWDHVPEPRWFAHEVTRHGTRSL